MPRSAFHPKAHLLETRNVRQGLDSRSKIIMILERKNATAKTLAEQTMLNYRVVFHHLWLLEAERIVEHSARDHKPYIWNLTGVGQQKLKTT